MNNLETPFGAYWFPNIVETRKGFVISGQYYTDKNLRPVQGDFAGFKGGEKIINIKNYMFVGEPDDAMYTFRHNNFGVIQDTTIPNRSYIKTNDYFSEVSNLTTFIYTVDEYDNEIQIKNEASNGDIDWKSIIDQNDDYLYVLGKHTKGWGYYFCRIPKSNTSFTNATWICNSGFSNTKNIYEILEINNSYIYFIARHQYSKYRIYQYNKNSNTITYKDTTKNNYSVDDTNTVTYNNIYLNFNLGLVINDNHYVFEDKVVTFIPQKMTEYNAAYVNSTLDWDNNMSDDEAYNYEVNCQIACYVYDKSKPFTDENKFYYMPTNIRNNPCLVRQNENSNRTVYRYWVIENKYLCMANYNENSTATYIPFQAINIFEIQGIGQLKHLSCDRISQNAAINTMCYTDDFKYLLIGFKNSAELYMWNDETIRYEKTTFHLDNIMCCGFDKLQRIWYNKLDYSTYCQSLLEPFEVKIEFENFAYCFKGEPIESYVDFCPLDAIGRIAKGKYTLTLDGDSVFKENNSNKIIVDVENSELRLDILINSPVGLTCSVYFMQD